MRLPMLSLTIEEIQTPARLGERFEAGSDIYAIAVDVVPVRDHVAEIDADPQHDGRLHGASIRRRRA